MTKKWKITILVLAAIIAVGGVATSFFFTSGLPGKPILATVNGEKIPIGLFQEELGKIDSIARDLVKEDPGKLLEVIINRTLLLQQAKKEGVTAPKRGTATETGLRLSDSGDPDGGLFRSNGKRGLPSSGFHERREDQGAIREDGGCLRR